MIAHHHAKYFPSDAYFIMASRWLWWISAGIAVLALEALVYTEALKFLTVTAAFTILSLNLIAVALFSRWILREQVTRTRWLPLASVYP